MRNGRIEKKINGQKKKRFLVTFLIAFSADELLFDKEIAESLLMTRQIQIKLNEKRSKDFFYCQTTAAAGRDH